MLVKMEPSQTTRFRVSEGELGDLITPCDKAFILCHYGVPRLEVQDWALSIDIMGAEAYSWTFEDITGFESTELQAVIQCAGHPLDPTINVRNAANISWTGVRLSKLLEQISLPTSAKFLWMVGSDHGVYEDMTVGEHWAASEYVKDIPLQEALTRDPLLAYKMNGSFLTAEHGFPVRTVVPGYYGTNSVKWLKRLSIREVRAKSIFTTALYNDYRELYNPQRLAVRVPVWAMGPCSLIILPKEGDRIGNGELHVRGWCWGYDEIQSVSVSWDAGVTWTQARVSRRQGWGWQEFSLDARLPPLGVRELTVRATDIEGRSQPISGARNDCHAVKITID